MTDMGALDGPPEYSDVDDGITLEETEALALISSSLSESKIPV
jgi:hypothetical protein